MSGGQWLPLVLLCSIYTVLSKDPDVQGFVCSNRRLLERVIGEKAVHCPVDFLTLLP